MGPPITTSSPIPNGHSYGAKNQALFFFFFFFFHYYSLNFRHLSLITQNIIISYIHPFGTHYSTCHHSNFSTFCGPITVTWSEQNCSIHTRYSKCAKCQIFGKSNTKKYYLSNVPNLINYAILNNNLTNLPQYGRNVAQIYYFFIRLFSLLSLL